MLYGSHIKKPNDKLVYINVISDHTPSITKHMPKLIAHNLVTDFSYANIFNQVKIEYETVLEFIRKSNKPKL